MEPKRRKLNYYDQLKHPLWQRKRLEILQRDAWKCRECGEMNKQLSIHHMYYQKGKKLWEYPDQSILSLCEGCHEERAQVERRLLEFFQNNNFDVVEELMFSIAEHCLYYPQHDILDICTIINRTLPGVKDRKTEYQI